MGHEKNLTIAIMVFEMAADAFYVVRQLAPFVGAILLSQSQHSIWGPLGIVQPFHTRNSNGLFQYSRIALPKKKNGAAPAVRQDSLW